MADGTGRQVRQGYLRVTKHCGFVQATLGLV